MLSLSGSTGGRAALSDHERHERLLGVQAVLRLIPRRRPRSVEDVLGDLLAVVRGEAVHDDAALRGEPEGALVDSVRLEVLDAAVPLLVLAHARPDVRVEDVRLARRLFGV